MAKFFDFLWDRRDDLFSQFVGHVIVVAIAVALACGIGVALGVATYRSPRGRGVALGVASVFLTIPSFALFVLLIPIFQLGNTDVIIALTLYGLLPVLRNTITGLREVDSAVVESAQGVGMGRWRRLVKIELPLAWPVILVGIRVTTVVLVGIAAIGAIVLGGGFGNFIFGGLDRVGTPVAVSMVGAGMLGTVVVAILFDAALATLGRITTSRGLK